MRASEYSLVCTSVLAVFSRWLRCGRYRVRSVGGCYYWLGDLLCGDKEDQWCAHLSGQPGRYYGRQQGLGLRLHRRWRRRDTSSAQTIRRTRLNIVLCCINLQPPCCSCLPCDLSNILLCSVLGDGAGLYVIKLAASVVHFDGVSC
jgi:hypothetical protein